MRNNFMKIYNTLSRKSEEFEPLNPPHVSFYQCGPTVYWTQHIGNMRAMVLADLIRRTLDYCGYETEFARNYTDVGHLSSDEDEGEDKLEKGAKREGLTPLQLADKYVKQFEADTAALNCLEPDFKPRATEYIEPMAEMVQELIDKGFAYATDLAIYFDVSKAKDYTKLSGQKLEMNQADSGRAEVGDTGKKSPIDFAVWFFKTGAHENALQTWGHKFSGISQSVAEGFPGWHLECSAMCYTIFSQKFGPTIDIHMGGIEHVPVHHTNEIAQSEAVTGKQFVKYWIHNEHLTVDGGKMSKSDGTAYSVADIIAKGYDPLVLRYFFLGAHYRSKQNFTWEALDAAKSALENIRQSVASWSLEDANVEVNEEYKQKFISALSEDFNSPAGLAVVFELLKSEIADGAKLATILDFDQVLGLGLAEIKTEEIPAEITELAEERLKARADKNWSESDRLRDELAKQGWQVKDSKDGYKLQKI